MVRGAVFSCNTDHLQNTHALFRLTYLDEELFFDLFEGDGGSFWVVDPFAEFSGLFPLLFGAYIFWPPGEGAALFGTGRVDGAFFALEEDTVVGLQGAL